MSRLRFNEVATPNSPSSGKVEVFASNDPDPLLRAIDDGGNIRSLSDIFNYSVAAQSIPATTRTYITGSKIAIPVTKLRIGTILKWRFSITKTAVGSSPSTFDIAFGTTGTVSDTARVSFIKPAGTGVADEGWVEIMAIVRGPLSVSGIVVAEFILTHNLLTTGHATINTLVINGISSAFDVTTPTFVGICLTSGTSDAITVQLVIAEALNL